jgi:hypothetical protein
MGLDCAQLGKIVQSFSLVRECDKIRNGMLRISTPFQYPDGSQVDVFLGSEEPLFPDKLVLTDLGQTTAYLLDLQVKPWATAKRKQIISDICSRLDVELRGGALTVSLVNAPTEIPQAIVRLAQACIRIPDVAFTQRFRTASVLNEEFEEFLAQMELDYDGPVRLAGAFENEVEVEFQVRGRHVVSLIQTLSTANSNAAHGLSNEVFRKWYDLKAYTGANQFVTIYDTTNDVFRADDLNRLSTLSTVLGFPAEQQSIRMALAA